MTDKSNTRSYFGGETGGNAHFSTPFNATVASGQWITATATDTNGNTSEFSKGLQAVAAPALLVELFASQTPKRHRGTDDANSPEW
jgi:hypothetical protein